MKQTMRLKGMTLTELLVVLAILGVLLLLSFPVLQPLLGITHELEAKTNLKHLSELQKVYHMEYTRFTDQFQELGFEQGKLVNEENGTAHYQIEIVQASLEDFSARATSITDFDGDGTFNVWEINKAGIPREVTPD